MHRDALVQVQQPPPVVLLDHLDELVVRGLLVEQAVGRLDGSRWDRDESGQQAGDDEVAGAEQEAGREREERGDDEERSLRAERGDENERREERPQERAGGRERVQPSRDRAGGLDGRDREPDRERRHHPEQDDRRRAQEQHRDEAPHHGSDRRLVEPFDGQIEERLGDERDRRHAERGPEDDEAEQRRVGPAVGDAPAEPVSERERGEDDPDEVRPDDRGRAEVRGEQTRRRDLGRERADAGAEDQGPELEAAPSTLAGHLEPEDALDLAERPCSEEDRGREHDDEDHPEPDARPPLLAMPPLARRAAGAVEPVRALDGLRIERRLVLSGSVVGSTLAMCGFV